MFESCYPKDWSGLALTVTLAFTTACGGGNTQPDTPEPSRLAIMAGDAQTAAPGSAVAINPSVRVTDSKGAAIAGVRVSFTVTQGGGSIADATPTSGSDGIATAGRWTLGTVGPQRLNATVSGVTPVSFTATAAVSDTGTGPGGQQTTQSIGTAGGSVVIDWPGSPLNGAKLTLDPGALTSTTPLTLRSAPVTGVTLPAGITPLTPGLTISGASGPLKAAAALKLPIPTGNQGKLLMLAMADPITGKMTLLPTIRQDASSVTALLASMDAGRVPTAIRTPSSRLLGLYPGALANQDEGPSSLIFMAAINAELLNRDFDTGFRPGVDDWDFPRMAVPGFPFLDGDGIFAYADDGMVSTALWYYINRRKGGGPKLNGSTQLLEGEPLSSRAGIRWAALANKDVPPFNQVGSLLIKNWNEWVTDDRGRFLWLQFQGIKAQLLTTLETPVPVVLLDTDSSYAFNDKVQPLAIAYQTVGNTLYLSWAGSPGVPIQVQFSESGMTPFTLTGANGTPLTVRALGGVQYLNVVNGARLAAQWNQVSAGTIGEAEGWPRATLHWEKDQLDTARVYLANELQLWWQCAGCVEKVSTPPQLPPTANHVQRFRMIEIPGGSGLSALFSSAKLSSADITGDKQMSRSGFVLQYPGLAAQGGVATGWLDWQTVVFRKLKLTPSLEKIELKGDSTITLGVAPSETPPAGTRYRWMLRTEDKVDSVETTVPTHIRELEEDTKGWLIFSALEGAHKRIIARDSIPISSQPKLAAWRILTLADASELLEDIDAGGGGQAALLVRLIQSPTSGLIQVMEDSSGSTLMLRVKRSGSWGTGDCCPIPPVNSGTERTTPLGFKPTTTYSMGPFFAGWGSSFWNQTTDNLESGTVTGQYILGLNSYRIKDAGNQIGPAGAMRIEANRSGTQMTGNLAVYIWWVPEDTGELSEGPEVYLLPFTAVRVR